MANTKTHNFDLDVARSGECTATTLELACSADRGTSMVPPCLSTVSRQTVLSTAQRQRSTFC